MHRDATRTHTHIATITVAIGTNATAGVVPMLIPGPVTPVIATKTGLATAASATN
jgi:hypothetical protein